MSLYLFTKATASGALLGLLTVGDKAATDLTDFMMTKKHTSNDPHLEAKRAESRKKATVGGSEETTIIKEYGIPVNGQKGEPHGSHSPLPLDSNRTLMRARRQNRVGSRSYRIILSHN